MPIPTRADMRHAEDACSPGFLTRATVAEMLGVTPRWVAGLLRASNLPYRLRTLPKGRPGLYRMVEIPWETAARLLWYQCRTELLKRGHLPFSLHGPYSRWVRSGVIPAEPPWLKRASRLKLSTTPLTICFDSPTKSRR